MLDKQMIEKKVREKVLRDLETQEKRRIIEYDFENKIYNNIKNESDYIERLLSSENKYRIYTNQSVEDSQNV